ncbi:MAG: leucine-rich repeat domain-containing protein [Candidatus Didemnitutus sp.]|nr:leucine-rich repeat domain-containing protein [Candidatus Didemnitutus sp.]
MRRIPRLSSTFAALLVLSVASASAFAVTLQDYARDHPLTLFIATKGAVMPTAIDQTNNLQEGDRALLLSGLDLTDLTGLSELTVDDAGQKRPITEVAHLHLFLNRNRIESLPEELGRLKQVKFLYLEFNRLQTLPLALRQMDALEGMYFTSNRFTTVPPFVYTMRKLKKLQFSRNQLSELPPEIGHLTELRHLNLSGNRIATVPATIGRLTRLRVCDLSDNQISELPTEFGQVKIVNQLRVRNNPLTTLPEGFADMRATIDITGTKIDPAKLSPGLRARIGTEKPPGSKPDGKIIVRSPAK